MNPENAARLVKVFDGFGFPGVSPEVFLTPGRIARAGNQPLRLEILNRIAGVEFDACFKRREVIDVDGLRVNIISLRDLLINKRAAGRAKDLADVEAFESRDRAGPKARSRIAATKKRPR